MASPPLFSLFFIAAFWVSIPRCHCSGDRETHHIVAVQNLLPRHVPSSQVTDEYPESLKIVHRLTNLTPKESLTLDVSRAEWLRQRRRSAMIKMLHPDSMTTVPAHSGRAMGTGNYLITVGVGTPKKDLSLVFDTGSDLTWIQCQPCSRFCYQQDEAVFDPRLSSSYKNVSCSARECFDLQAATGNKPGCSTSNCVYGIRYGDGSYSVGFFASETLTLKNADVLSGVRFGCGENNKGLFGQAAGLLGLGRGKVSVVLQTARKYGKVFSYCLPSNPMFGGYLTLGSKKVTDSRIQYTPMLTDVSEPSYYFLEIVAIKVGGKILPIPQGAFAKAGGALLDSGTVISRLPPAVYSMLRSAFQEEMTGYSTAASLSILDTCYDFTGRDTVSIPKITIIFKNNAFLDVHVSGILYVAKISQMCLAFAGNDESSDLAILGNAQQKTYDIVYDVAKGAIGFAKGGCS